MGKVSSISVGIGLVVVLVAGRAQAQAPAEEMGYPRPFSFRSINQKNLPYLDWMGMVISDFHLRTRLGADIEFKRRHPSRPVLAQINSEGLGLWGTWICLPDQRLADIGFLKPRSLEVFTELSQGIYPIGDFPGYWVYEAGADTTTEIPDGATTVTVTVADVAPFLASTHPHSTNRLKRPSFMKDIVICPRDSDGQLVWLNAEFASIVTIDENDGKLTLRRWDARDGTRRRHAKGTYLAPNANQIVLGGFPKAWNKYLGLRELPYYTPFLPNVTRHCPRDPRTGLNAAEWLARHYIEVKKKHYPTLDGYVFDVSAGTFHPSNRISPRSDCDVDGLPDCFYFDGLDYWALGMYDFMSYLREGRPGMFAGLGDGLAIVSDANMNDENRFFELLNGAEYEFGTINPFSKRQHTFSSALDRYLLWTSRSRTPRLTYIHNKYPVDSYHAGSAGDLAYYMHDSYYRLDIATACMGTGYVGKDVSRPGGHPAVGNPLRKQQIEEFGTPMPLDWDEYRCGDEDKRNWLGRPLGAPVRLSDHLSRRVMVWSGDRASASLEASPPYEARWVDATRKGGARVKVGNVLPYENTGFKVRLGFAVRGLEKGREYTLRLRASGPSPYAKAGEEYASIPRNLETRLIVGEAKGLSQEALVFAEPRQVFLALTAPAAGDGWLQFGLGEEPGEIELFDIALFEGCADVMWRKFDGGLALLNGSATTPFEFDFDALFPGESYRRIAGRQDPVHNSGRPVVGRLTLAPRDGILLKRGGA